LFSFLKATETSNYLVVFVVVCFIYIRGKKAPAIAGAFVFGGLIVYLTPTLAPALKCANPRAAVIGLGSFRAGASGAR